MNRAFLIAVVPAVLVAAGYLIAFRSLGWPVSYAHLAGAFLALALAVVAVRYYHRRKARPRRG